MTRSIALAAAITLALALGGGLWWQSGRTAALPETPILGAASAQEAAEVDTSTVAEMALGAEDAPVTVIEYASFTCPHCADFHADQFKKLKADYVDTGKVRFVFRETYSDRYGLWASMIARCGSEDRFFGMTDLIFKGQEDWVRAGGPTEIVGELRKIGRLAGLEEDQLEACLSDADKAQTLVAWYQQNATADEIEATPSLVINGQKYSNMAYDELSALIDEKLGE